jgi:DNA-binding transcriptional regulator YdaS (Cro superfamily)
MPKTKPPAMSPQIRRALDRAIEILGGIVKASERLEVTVAALQNWRSRGVPAGRALQLEELTGVSRKRLRPDPKALNVHR